ncbi:baculoviral IAP repeat-containing protein 3-like isoform X2 [Liolophura sinensis]|uniref:baculoviral IAP repeat-containing protein 3-like isoform X2 n=1 Tax=Liolophura sinensis TaxID=3198878 RepID=UPI0031590411
MTTHIVKRSLTQRGGGRPAPGSQDPSRAAVRVKYPDYADFQSRMATFRLGSRWPTDKSQTPVDVAMAGLFFAGVDDCTRCFSCGGGLRNWLPGDDPIVEHARFFPECQYIIGLKGEAFVANVNRDYPRENFTGDTEVDGPSVSEPAAPVVDYEQMVRSVMLKPCGMALDVLGYSRRLIRDAAMKVLSENGWNESLVTSQLLANACFDLQDAQKNDTSSDRSPPPSNAEHATSSADSVPPPEGAHAGVNAVDGPPSPTDTPSEAEAIKMWQENRRMKETLKYHASVGSSSCVSAVLSGSPRLPDSDTSESSKWLT